MKKRIVSLILALCMLLSTGFVLASCAIDKESEKESSSDKVSMSNFVKKLGYLDEKGELDDLEVLEGDAAASEIEGAVKYVEAESEDGEGFWAVEFKEESRAKEFYEEMKAAAEEDDEGVTFKRSGKIVYAYSDKAFYDRIMAAKAPSAQTPGGNPGGSLPSDKPKPEVKPEDGPESEPSWSTNEELVATKLSKNSIKNFFGEIKDEYVRPSEILGDALSQVNLYAEYDGAYVSMKDGYLVVDSQGNRYVHGIKNNYGVSLENGELYDWEKLFEEPSETELADFCDDIANLVDTIFEMGDVSELTASDVMNHSGNWYDISTDFIRGLIIGAMKASVVTAGTNEDNMTAEEKEMFEQVEERMRALLDYISISVSFRVENDGIRGIRVWLQIGDLTGAWNALYGGENGEVYGNLMYDMEIVLNSDRTEIESAFVDSSFDIEYADAYEAVCIDGSLDMNYAGNQFVLSGHLDYENCWDIYCEGWSVTVDHMTVNFDDENNPVYLAVSGRLNLIEMGYGELVDTIYTDFDGDGYDERMEISIPVYADAAYNLDLELNLDALKNSGRAIDATLGVNISNARIYDDQVLHFTVFNEKDGYKYDYEMRAGDARWYFSYEAVENALNTDYDNGNIRVDLYTEKGRGELYVEQDFPNDYQQVYVQVEVNGDNYKDATEAEKEQIQSFRPEDHYEDPAPIEPNPVEPNPDVPNQGKASYEKLAFEVFPSFMEEYGETVSFDKDVWSENVMVKELAAVNVSADFFLAVATFYDKEAAKTFYARRIESYQQNGYVWDVRFFDEYTVIYGTEYLVYELVCRSLEETENDKNPNTGFDPEYSYTYVDNALWLVAVNYGANVVYYSSTASGITSGQYLKLDFAEISIDYYEYEWQAQEFAQAYKNSYYNGENICYVQGNRVVYGSLSLVNEVLNNVTNAPNLSEQERNVAYEMLAKSVIPDIAKNQGEAVYYETEADLSGVGVHNGMVEMVSFCAYDGELSLARFNSNVDAKEYYETLYELYHGNTNVSIEFVGEDAILWGMSGYVGEALDRANVNAYFNI